MAQSVEFGGQTGQPAVVDAEARDQDGGVEIQTRADSEAQDIGDYGDSFHAIGNPPCVPYDNRGRAVPCKKRARLVRTAPGPVLPGHPRLRRQVPKLYYLTTK